MWPRMSWCGTMLLFLAGSFAGMDDTHAFMSCEPLKRLLAHADTGFRQLRGYRDPRLRAWVATYRMSGAARCTIEDIEDTAYYACKWGEGPQSGSDADVYPDLLEFVTRCVSISATSEHSDSSARQSVRFGVTGSRKTVVVEKEESPHSGRLVTLYIIPLGLAEISQE